MPYRLRIQSYHAGGDKASSIDVGQVGFLPER